MPKGFFKENGSTKPITPKNGITPEQLKISVKGNNDKIEIGSKTKGMNGNREGRIKEIRVFKFDELEPEAKEKVLEKWRNEFSAQDTYYADDDGILYMKDGNKEIVGYEIFKGNIPKYWNVGYGHEYIQFELSVKDEKKFTDTFGLSKDVLEKISNWGFENKNENNTEIVFYDINGSYIDLDEPYKNKNNFGDITDDEKPTVQQYEKLQKAHSKFNDLMDDSLKHLRANYDYEFDEERIKETIEINEYEFLSDGRFAPRE